ncbi:MAG: metallophosphoesterase family protein [Anaerolineales bacterium]
MKIALIGDVHANLPALEAIIEHAHQREVEAFWNVGDWVGYFAHPDEVVRRIRREEAISIVGNYDLKVLKAPKKGEKWRESKHPLKWLAFGWAFENLSEESRAFLRSLPKEVRLEMCGWRVLLTHGSPASNEEPLTPQTPEARLHELIRMARADVIVCGHSHQPFTRQVEGVWFVNAGSVGRPDDGDPRASYAVLTLDVGELQVAHYRVKYDLERAVRAVRQAGLPEAFARMLLQGRALDAIESG